MTGQRARRGLGGVLQKTIVFTLWGCFLGPSQPRSLMSLGARNLRCQRTELETALHRESSQVREYYVGCDFMYTRVLCTKDECHPAGPQPPCFAGGCFKEDPVTFEWELPEGLASNEAAPDTNALFSSP